MHQKPSARLSSQSSFMKVLFLGIVLALVLVATHRLQRNGLPGALNDLLSQSQSARPGQYAPLNESEQTAHGRRLAGFWSAELRGQSEAGSFDGWDRIELKDNGIVWRVTHYTLRLPGGDSVYYQRTYDAYLRPFGWVKEKDSVLACDVRILRQATIAGPDTCFGPGPLDVVWDVGMRSPAPAFAAAVEYQSYSGDIKKFFPADAIAMLQRAYNGEPVSPGAPSYRVGKHELDIKKGGGSEPAFVLELPECSSDMSPAGYVHALAADSGGALVPVLAGL
jgi:hypothetical protein